MDLTTKKKRVNELLQKFEDARHARRIADAALALREATALDPENPGLEKHWHWMRVATHHEEFNHPALAAFLAKGDDESGKEALQAVRLQELSREDVGAAIRDLSHLERRPLTEAIGAAILRQSEARKWLAQGDDGLLVNATPAFQSVWKIGAQAVLALTDCLTDKSSTSPWKSEDDRIECERSTVLLLLAKLIEPGEDERENAMQAIGHLMGVDSANVVQLIDEENFDIILSSLDIEKSPALRSRATLVTAKMLEEGGSRIQGLLKQFVICRIKVQRVQDLVVAFSVAASIFPIVPEVASNLFLSSSFLENLDRVVRRTKSSRLKLAILELVSAACVDKACREAIARTCMEWLRYTSDCDPEDQHKAMAGLVVAKVSGDLSDDTRETLDGIVMQLQNLMIKHDPNSSETAIEGLAYSSVQPRTKERLAGLSGFLDELFKTLGDDRISGTTLFGGLTIISNLTSYNLPVSAEQKRMQELKAYANQSRPASKEDPLDDDAHVTARCKKVLEAGFVSLIAEKIKQQTDTSTNFRDLVSTALVSLARERAHHGAMIQQGALEVLVYLANSRAPTTVHTPSSEIVVRARLHSALALALLLIYVDPRLVFSGSSAVSVEASIRAINLLLVDASDPSTVVSSAVSPEVSVSQDISTTTIAPRTWASFSTPRARFEALRALTTIATLSQAGRNAVVRLSWPLVTACLWSNATAVVQAATECIANLCSIEEPAEVPNHAVMRLLGRGADAQSKDDNSLILLFAFAAAGPSPSSTANGKSTKAALNSTKVDPGTRRAALGALCNLLYIEGAWEAIKKKVDRAAEKIVEIENGENGEDDAECRVRATVLLAMLAMTNETAKKEVREAGGVAALKNALSMGEKGLMGNKDMVVAAVAELEK